MAWQAAGTSRLVPPGRRAQGLLRVSCGSTEAQPSPWNWEKDSICDTRAPGCELQFQGCKAAALLLKAGVAGMQCR